MERRNASWKAIWEKTCKHEVILPSEVSLGITAVNDAKNCLRNRDGYAPRQWVFGSMPREVGDIMEEPDSFETLKVTKDGKMSRINAGWEPRHSEARVRAGGPGVLLPGVLGTKAHQSGWTLVRPLLGDRI